jgi:hypothetical protein
MLLNANEERYRSLEKLHKVRENSARLLEPRQLTTLLQYTLQELTDSREHIARVDKELQVVWKAALCVLFRVLTIYHRKCAPRLTL